jgi:hypothetical protein
MLHEVNDGVFGPIPVVLAVPVTDEAAVPAVLTQMKGDVRIAGDLGISEWPDGDEGIVL